jgi:crossover junction endodeoxyribonuclease RuvC
MSEPRVVGLDLSLTATGIAPSNFPQLRITYTVTTKTRGCERLAHIRDEVMKSCAPVEVWDPEWRMDAPLVVLEGYAYGRPNQAAHLGELGGVIRLALHEAGVPYVDVPPSNLKKYATGKGNAGKEEVLAAAIRRLGYEGHDNNQADALWLQAMGYDALGRPVVEMPAVNRAALEKVEWPS